MVKARKPPPRKPHQKGIKGGRREQDPGRKVGTGQGNRLLFIGVPVLVLLIAGVTVVLLTRERAPQPPARSFPIQGVEHIREGESHPPYNSNPPTSGWHYDTPALWGVQDRELPDEQLVHNLEHGGIWISYHPSLGREAVDKLKDIVRGYRSKVILTPRVRNDSKIALAAWGKLDAFDVFDEARVLAFIQAFKDQGPEKVPD